MLFPMVLLATVATIIASQALISGAFTLASQAMRLGLFPRLAIRHTHHAHAGQIYMPFINWGLYVGCILLVVAVRLQLGARRGLWAGGVGGDGDHVAGDDPGRPLLLELGRDQRSPCCGDPWQPSTAPSCWRAR